MRKNKVLEKFPVLRNLLKKKVVYERVERSEEYPAAHTEKYRGRVEHYVLKQEVKNLNILRSILDLMRNAHS